MMSNAAANRYATIGKSVSGGWVGLPDHPRNPLNVRPFRVSVGRTENLRIAASRGEPTRRVGRPGPTQSAATGRPDSQVPEELRVALAAQPPLRAANPTVFE